MSTIEEIRARAAAATPGPWGWFGNTDTQSIYLATQRWGRHFVMEFRRWGMQRAQPAFWTRSAPQTVKESMFGGGDVEYVSAADGAVYEVAPEATSRKDRGVYRGDVIGIRNPDAAFIAHSREDVDILLAEIDRLNELLTGGTR